MTSVAFIGLGNMGGPMAANLVKAGIEVHGFDLEPNLCEKAANSGVNIARSAKETLSNAQTAITMLPAGDNVVSVWRELVSVRHEDLLIIDCSTIDIGSARRAHELAYNSGARPVDAPVSGGVAGATARTLTFMCGGEAIAFEMAKPLLEKMGKTALYCGGAGLGQAAKICNNLMLGVAMIATAEAFALGEKLGLSHQALFDAASISSGQSWSLTNYCPVPGPTPSSPANNGYRPGFMAALMLKDLKLAQQAASLAGVASPLGGMAAQLYALYVANGHGKTDFSGIIEMIRGQE